MGKYSCPCLPPRTRVSEYAYPCHPITDVSKLFIFAEERFDEADGIEGFDVFGLFTEADELDGNVELLANGDDHAAFGRAVELGEDDAGDVDGLAEHLGLLDGVLAAGGVEDEEDFVGCPFDSASNHIANFY
jgi:hypothetical protein